MDDKFYFTVGFTKLHTKDFSSKIISLLDLGQIEFQPGYLKYPDGHIEIKEISIISTNKDKLDVRSLHTS